MIIYPTFNIEPNGEQYIDLIDPEFDTNEPIMSMYLDDEDCCCAWMQMLQAMLEQYDRGYDDAIDDMGELI